MVFEFCLKVTTTSQVTAERSKDMEPLKTLGAFRKGSTLGWNADPSWKHAVFFGEPTHRSPIYLLTAAFRLAMSCLDFSAYLCPARQDVQAMLSKTEHPWAANFFILGLLI